MTWSIGDSREKLVVDGLTRTQIVQYAGASGDYNPLHTDEIYATRVAGHPSVFAHGMLTMGLTGRLVSELAPVEDLLSFGGRFTSQVWPGDSLTAHAVVTEIDAASVHFAVKTVNQDGDVVFKGTASIRR